MFVGHMVAPDKPYQTENGGPMGFHGRDKELVI